MGSSFDEHVVGGYRFLMRFYCPGDEIYIFGFSRGSYIARCKYLYPPRSMWSSSSIELLNPSPHIVNH